VCVSEREFQRERPTGKASERARKSVRVRLGGKVGGEGVEGGGRHFLFEHGCHRSQMQRDERDLDVYTCIQRSERDPTICEYRVWFRVYE